jgi:hypothetical protein
LKFELDMEKGIRNMGTVQSSPELISMALKLKTVSKKMYLYIVEKSDLKRIDYLTCISKDYAVPNH